MKPFHIALAGFLSVLSAGATTLDFQNYSTGALNGQNGWSGNTNVVIASVPGPDGSGGNTISNLAITGGLYTDGSTIGLDMAALPNDTLEFDFKSVRGGANAELEASTNGTALDGFGYDKSYYIRPDGTVINTNYSVNNTDWYRVSMAINVTTGSMTLNVIDLTTGTSPFTTIVDGTFFTNTSYTTAQTRQAYLNSLQGITLLVQKDGFTGSTDAVIDNIQLDQTATPEPASLALAASGLLAGLVLSRRRARKQASL